MTRYQCQNCGRIRNVQELTSDKNGVHCKKSCTPKKVLLARSMGNFETTQGDPGDSLRP